MLDPVKRAEKNLIKNGFKVKIFDSEEEAKDYLLKTISKGEEIGVGGSKTLRGINIVQALKERGNRVYDHWEAGLSPEEILEIRRKQLLCDVFLTSSNAVTEKGEIVNREGVGNRINAMTFGPKRVFIVVGKNKIVKDIDSAIDRIKKISAPMRNKSLNTKNPCVKKGECMDCNLPTRICRVTHIIHRCPSNSDITVVIIKKDLGY
jgi:L-lactate utilization protein LutB